MSAIRRLIPLADRVLVRKVVAPTKTAGGLFLPDSAVQKEIEAEVLEVGKGAMLKDGTLTPMSLKKGDKVLLPEYGGHALQIGNEELHLFRQDEILGKFE